LADGNGKTLLHRFPYPYTSVTLAIALIVLAVGLFSNIDVFELPSVVIPGIEPSEMGEIVTAFLLVIPALVVDHIVARQRAHEHELVAEQLRVVLVTMRTVQDIVNNNLNQMQLLRLEAEGHVSDEILTLFDEAVRNTAAELTELGNMKVFAEKAMAAGSGLDVSPRGPT
jgi:hypothetical protein